MKAVVFGAGNIGRGFLGQLFSQSGYEIVFIDVVDEIIDRINRDGLFPIHIVSGEERTYIVKNVSAVKSTDTETVTAHIESADILATAVGVNVLPKIAPSIAAGLGKRFDSGNSNELNIIICENIIESGKHLKSLVLKHLEQKYRDIIDQKIGFIATVVSRMVPVPTEQDRKENPAQVKVEPYCILPVDKPAFRGALPQIEGFQYIDDLIAYEERKIFTHNAGHALCAYLGYFKGLKYIYEAIGDAYIKTRALEALMETGEALIKKHGFTDEEHRAHIDDLFHRFANVALGDTVARVGRDPIRKLGYNDRFIGGARLAIEYGIEPVNIVHGICAALRFDNPDDEKAVELQQMLKDKGLDYTLNAVCGLSPDDKLFGMIKKYFKEMQ